MARAGRGARRSLTAPAAEASERSNRREPGAMAWVTTTYFAEGLPYSVVHQIASQFFTAMHASLESIGLVSLYGLAWNLKFAWSPLVDLLGTVRRWLIVLELLLAASIAWIAWPAHHGDLGAVARALVVVAVLVVVGVLPCCCSCAGLWLRNPRCVG